MAVRSRSAVVVSLAAAFALLVAVPAASAHGGVVPAEPTAGALLLGWSFDPSIWLPVLLAAAVWLWAVRRVARAHPANPVPAMRSWAFLGGLAAILVALQSGIERYDTTLFSVHMVQHLLLVFAAAPLIVLAAPVTLALRAATPAGRRRLLVVLRSGPARAIGHPVVAWLLFAAAMWGSHVTPLFDAALEDPIVHDLEHVLYLVSAVLLWLPVAGVDPSPWRLPYPARILYLLLQLPLNSFLGVVILFATSPLYPHYVTTGRTWGPSALEDQKAAGAIMWGVGDLAFLVAILLVIAAWMRAEEAATRRREAVEDARAGEDTRAVAARAAADGGQALARAASGDGPGAPGASGSVPGAPAAGPGGIEAEAQPAPGIGAAR